MYRCVTQNGEKVSGISGLTGGGCNGAGNDLSWDQGAVFKPTDYKVSIISEDREDVYIYPTRELEENDPGGINPTNPGLSNPSTAYAGTGAASPYPGGDGGYAGGRKYNGTDYDSGGNGKFGAGGGGGEWQSLVRADGGSGGPAVLNIFF